MQDLKNEPSIHFKNKLQFILQTPIACSKKKTDKKLLLTTLNSKNNAHIAHSKRVAKLATKLAKQLKLTKLERKKIKLAALFHDVGKLGISEKILNSPHKLTDEEFQIVKQHSKIGFQLLMASKNLQELSHYVLQHHERFDGTGYPNGIIGKNISLPARIISIADSYDAMTSNRPYREAYSKEKAIDELKRCAGTQFDPELVVLFINKVI